MTKETEAILRAVLFSSLRTDDISEVRLSIMAMCSDDDISVVKARIAELKEQTK